MKRFYTSNYARNGTHRKAVAISRKAPIYYMGKIFIDLAPTWTLISDYKKRIITEQQYTKQYLALLEQRDNTPQQIVDMFEDQTIFLCYEAPNDFCHRHIVAKWLEENTGIKVVELTTSMEQQEFLNDLLQY